MRVFWCVLLGAGLCGDALAQGGGPPMLTDDPGTVDLHTLEINLSVNAHLLKRAEWEAPLIDVNYGLLEGVQLKVEWPLLLAETGEGQYAGRAGNPSVGVKCRLLQEENAFLSVSTYPAVSIPVEEGDRSEVKIPVELERSIGPIIVGDEIGYVYRSPHAESLINGTLLGICPLEGLQVMMELYWEKELHASRTTGGYVNVGMRYDFNATWGMLASAGTECITPDDAERERFFSFLGVQLRL
jgi:hypothetical protein